MKNTELYKLLGRSWHCMLPDTCMSLGGVIMNYAGDAKIMIIPTSDPFKTVWIPFADIGENEYVGNAHVSYYNPTTGASPPNEVVMITILPRTWDEL
ncbi:hypothetical protein COB55_04640 [Candidatus Wolfebacteria bacterium]|nr:MAG: hypothetical protein COB55_04640 [Candidatus Wolfebacteria bacterium]